MEETEYFYEKLIPAHLRVFLGVKGMTMSEANHRANMVKEELVKVSSELANTNGYSSTTTIQGKTLHIDNYKKVEDLAYKCQLEGKYYGLSAWLREAVSAKSSALQRCKAFPEASFVLEDDYELAFNLEKPLVISIVMKSIDENDVLDKFTIKERAEYFMVEAEAAHLGKKLHPGNVTPQRGNGLASQVTTASKEGKLKEIREQVLNFQKNELKEMKVGRDEEVVILDNVALYTAGEIERIYMLLQSQHRSLEARLNFYKARIKDELSALKLAANEEYRSEFRKVNNEYAKELAEYNAKYQEHTKKLTDYETVLSTRKLKLVRYISKLNIIIPEVLEPLNQEIAALGKEESA